MGRKLAVNTQLLWVVLALAFTSCSNPQGHERVKEQDVWPIKEVSHFKNELFPYQVESIIPVKNHLLLCEFGNDRISMVDTALSEYKVLIHPGSGPNEVIAPLNFALDKDKFMVFSDSKRSLAEYKLPSGEYSASIKSEMSHGIFERFTVTSKKILYSDGNSSWSIIDRESGDQKSFNEYFDIDYLSEKERTARNTRHIIEYQNRFLAISATEPIVEFLDEDGSLIERVEIPTTKSIDSRLRFRDQEFEMDVENRNATYYLFDDVFVDKNLLYGLIYYQDPITQKTLNNKMVVYEVNGFELLAKKEITLKNSYDGTFYSSICTIDNGKKMIAYEAIGSSLQVFKLNQ